MEQKPSEAQQLIIIAQARELQRIAANIIKAADDVAHVVDEMRDVAEKMPVTDARDATLRIITSIYDWGNDAATGGTEIQKLLRYILPKPKPEPTPQIQYDPSNGDDFPF